MGHPHERITDYQDRHYDVHDCQHDCDCFWCRVSRRERLDPIIESFGVSPPDIEEARAFIARDMVDATITATRKRLSAAEAAGRTDDVEEQGAYLRGLLFARECFIGPVTDAPCPHVIHDPVGDPTSENVTTWVCRRCGDPYPHK